MKTLIILLGLVAFTTHLCGEDTFTTKEFRGVRSKGLKRDVAKLQALKSKAKKATLERGVPVVSGKMDLTPLVSPPEDQGQCGSCWDFSITKALRSALMLAGL